MTSLYWYLRIPILSYNDLKKSIQVCFELVYIASSSGDALFDSDIYLRYI